MTIEAIRIGGRSMRQFIIRTAGRSRSLSGDAALAKSSSLRATESGLLLWFQVVFPTLFPFMLVSGLMLAGGGLAVISRLIRQAVLHAVWDIAERRFRSDRRFPVRVSDGRKSIGGSCALRQDFTG